MKLDDVYYYCTVHKRALLEEDIVNHGDESCNLIIEHFDWTPPKRKAKPFVAATIVERERMIRYRLPKIIKPIEGPFLPKNAVMIDTPTFNPKVI